MYMEHAQIINDSKTIEVCLGKISSITGMPLNLIKRKIKEENQNLKLIKIFSSWLLVCNLKFSEKESSEHLGEDANTVSYFLGTHFSLLEDTSDEGDKYRTLCRQLRKLYTEEKAFFEKDIPTKYEYPDIDQGRKMYLDKNQHCDSFADSVLAVVASHARYSKEVIVSTCRKRIVVYARYVFIRIMKNAFPKISLQHLGSYLGDKDHATVLNALRNHENLMQTKDHECVSLFISSNEDCMILPTAFAGYPSTFARIEQFLQSENIPRDKIESIKNEMITRFLNQYVFKKSEVQLIFSACGIVL